MLFQASRPATSTKLASVGWPAHRALAYSPCVFNQWTRRPSAPSRLAISAHRRSSGEALLLNVGFPHRTEKSKRDIRLSKMNVASPHSEIGCHEDSMFLLRQVCQHHLLDPVLFRPGHLQRAS